MIFFLIWTVVLSGSILGEILQSYVVNNRGNISHVTTVVGVSVFEDPQLNTIITEIDWGTILVNDKTVNTTVTKTIYLQNTGNATGTYFLNTYNWDNINVESFIILSWDFVGTLEPDVAVPVILTLTVLPNIPLSVTSFTFDIIIDTEKV